MRRRIRASILGWSYTLADFDFKNQIYFKSNLSAQSWFFDFEKWILW